jgi:lipopolysaccharide export system permease protein
MAPAARHAAPQAHARREGAPVRRLDRYIVGRVAGGWMIVLLLLASVFSLQTFLEELDNIGRGRYHLLSALAFVALTLPDRLVQLVPVTALLGTLVGLGTLASGSELVAMQATGVSARRVGWAVLKAGAVLVVIALALAQYVAPPLDQIAQTRRTLEISAASDLRTAHAFWSRDGTRFLNVRDIRHDRIPAGIDLYEFDAEGRLHTFIHAGRADVFNRRLWVLIGVVRKTFSGRGVTVEHIPRMPWRSFLRVQQMDLLLYDDLVLHEPGLKLPRPDLIRHAFILGPIAEIAGDLHHPVSGRPLRDLWEALGAQYHTLRPLSFRPADPTP